MALWLACSAFSWPGRVPHLRYMAAHAADDERVTALRLLVEYPSQASSDAFLSALEDEDTAVRIQAARAVGLFPDPRAAANLLDLARARDPAERAAALQALGALGLPSAAPTLEEALHDPAPEARVAAARALSGLIATGHADPGTLSAALSPDDAAPRLAAAQTLARAHAADDQPAHSDREPTAPAPTALLELLRELARDDSADVRAAALRALGRLREARALPELLRGLADRDETVQLQALAALGDSNLAGAVAPLRARAASADARAAQTAFAALGRIDDAGALHALQSLTPWLVRPALARSGAAAWIARARRLRDASTVQSGLDALRRAIETATADHALAALADGLVQLAGFADAIGAADAAPARLSLRHALEQGRGDALALTEALLQLHASPLLPSLAQRLAHAQQARAEFPDQRLATPHLLAAVTLALQAEQEPAALAGALRAFVDSAANPTSPELLRLRALLEPASARSSGELRNALAQVAATAPTLAASLISTEQLVELLDDTDRQTRQLASDALAQTGGPEALPALVARLEQAKPHPGLAIEASAGLLYRYPGHDRLQPALRERLLQQLRSRLTARDSAVAMSALFALRASHDARAARWIAGLLRGASPTLRAAAREALGDFDLKEARQLLRETLRSGAAEQAVGAALALGEIGSDRDVEALRRAAERGIWPLPPAAAYAAARIVQGGATRKHSLERVLCRFARQRDTYVLANIVSALATLGADRCDSQIAPPALMDETLPSALRVAAALWLRSMRPRTPEAIAEQTSLLARCGSDRDPGVARACLAPEPAGSVQGKTWLRALQGDGSTPLRSRVLALRFPDATVYVGRSDASGRVLLPRATPGSIVLEDPADNGAVALPKPTAGAPSDL